MIQRIVIGKRVKAGRVQDVEVTHGTNGTTVKELGPWREITAQDRAEWGMALTRVRNGKSGF